MSFNLPTGSKPVGSHALSVQVIPGGHSISYDTHTHTLALLDPRIPKYCIAGFWAQTVDRNRSLTSIERHLLGCGVVGSVHFTLANISSGPRISESACLFLILRGIIQSLKPGDRNFAAYDTKIGM